MILGLPTAQIGLKESQHQAWKSWVESRIIAFHSNYSRKKLYKWYKFLDGEMPKKETIIKVGEYKEGYLGVIMEY